MTLAEQQREFAASIIRAEKMESFEDGKKQGFKDGNKQGFKSGKKQGRSQQLKENIRTMSSNGFDSASIARALNLDPGYVARCLQNA